MIQVKQIKLCHLPCVICTVHTISVLCRVDKNCLLILDIKSKYCCNLHAVMTNPGTCATATRWLWEKFWESFLQLLGPIYRYLGHFIRTLLTTAVYVG